MLEAGGRSLHELRGEQRLLLVRDAGKGHMASFRLVAKRGDEARVAGPSTAHHHDELASRYPPPPRRRGASPRANDDEWLRFSM